jgi:hypothetical protein
MKPEPINPYPNVFISVADYSFPQEGLAERGASAAVTPRARHREDRREAPDGELAA